MILTSFATLLYVPDDNASTTSSNGTLHYFPYQHYIPYYFQKAICDLIRLECVSLQKLEVSAYRSNTTLSFHKIRFQNLGFNFRSGEYLVYFIFTGGEKWSLRMLELKRANWQGVCQNIGQVPWVQVHLSSQWAWSWDRFLNSAEPYILCL